MLVILILYGGIIFFTKKVSPLQCFHCTSEIDSWCETNPYIIKTCPNETRACMKIWINMTWMYVDRAVGHFNIPAASEHLVVRKCSMKNMDVLLQRSTDGCTAILTSNRNVFMYDCAEDLCNSSKPVNLICSYMITLIHLICNIALMLSR